MDFLIENQIYIVIGITIFALPFIFVHEKRTKAKRVEMIAKFGFEIVSASDFRKWTDIEKFENLKKEGINFLTISSLGLKEPMRGSFENLDFGLFLFSVADGSKTGKHQTATIIKTDANIPDFILRPEWMRDKFKNKLGIESNDINFRNHEKFSKKYFLESKNEAHVRSIFTQKVLDYFSELENVWIEVKDSEMLIFKEYDRLIDGSNFESYLIRGHEILNILTSKRDW